MIDVIFQSLILILYLNLLLKKDLDIGIKDLEYVLKTKSQETFMNDIRYNCKNGTIQKVSCSGTVFFIKDEPVLILGTHKLI